ncbi:unnamed protein product, partial [Leptidea sinapis]
MHRSRRPPPCDAPTADVTTCDPGQPHCAIVATAPPNMSVTIIVNQPSASSEGNPALILCLALAAATLAATNSSRFFLISSASHSPETIKIIKIGKYKVNENRPIKACFESEYTTKIILRNINKMKNDAIRIFSDQTPFQQARDEEAKRLHIPGYTHYYHYRKTTIGGGVSIFASNKLKHYLIEELS